MDLSLYIKNPKLPSSPKSILRAQEKKLFDDWILPSKDGLYLIYTELYLNGIGNISIAQEYWSSSENSANFAWALSFIDGTECVFSKDSTCNVMPIRIFNSEIDYPLGNPGPSGGYLFKKTYLGGWLFEYYELAPADQLSPDLFFNSNWSNVFTTAIDTTGTAIGTGKANTEDIIKQHLHTASAAKLCADLKFKLIVPKWNT